MSKTWRLLLLMAGTFVFAVVALVLASSQDHSTGMDHSKMDMPQGSDKSDAQKVGHTMQSVSTRHMDMGPHMRMTELRPATRSAPTRSWPSCGRRSPSIRTTTPRSTTATKSSCPT